MLKQISKSPSKTEPQQDPDDKVKIVIRLRPILNDEDQNEFVKLEDNHTIKILKPGSHSYMKFSNILDSQAKQADVFEQVRDSIESFMNGVNNTIFAYGQTGAGKTYSIIGDYSHLDSRDNLETYLTGNQRGILSRSLETIITELKKRKEKDSKIHLSFFEVYNEKVSKQSLYILLPNQIYDLYNNSTMPLEIRESKNGEISIPDLVTVQVTDISQAIEYLSIGLKNRATGSTHANSKSSRSHSIFQIYYQKVVRLPGGAQTIQTSSLRIVDLAGSEKFKIPSDLSPLERQIRIQQLTCINGSLSCLGHCISALIEKSRTHIPFRNSKLTRILSQSLIGQGRMKFVVCISPSMSASAETFSTLQFANRAKKAIVDRSPLKTSQLTKKASVGSEEFNQLKTQYERERELRMELEKQLKTLKSASNPYETELSTLRKQNRDLKEKVKKLMEQIKTVSQGSSMRSSHLKTENSLPTTHEDHQGLLKLSVFRQNKQILAQGLVNNGGNYGVPLANISNSINQNARPSTSSNPKDTASSSSNSKQIKKQDFENKVRRFMELESPKHVIAPPLPPPKRQNSASFSKNSQNSHLQENLPPKSSHSNQSNSYLLNAHQHEYSFNEEPHQHNHLVKLREGVAQVYTNNNNRGTNSHEQLMSNRPGQEEQFSLHPQEEYPEEQHETFEIYDECQSMFRSEEGDFDSNFIENTCKNMKVDCLHSLKEDMLRAKRELESLQQKDTNLEKKIQNVFY